MNKIKFLTGAVVALVVLNIVVLTALLKPDRASSRPEGPRKTIIERLRFDDAQTAAFDILVEKHRADIRRKDGEMAAARQAIYRQLKTNDFSAKDSLFAQAGQLQMEVEQIHFAHFQDIKNLCKPEQIDDFYKLTADLDRLFSKSKPPKQQ